MKRLLAATGLLLLIGMPLTGYAQLEERPLGFVTDNALLLNPEQRLELEEKLTQFEASTTIEIAVVTIPELPDNSTIELYAVELFEAWGIGKKQADNGVLFLTSLGDRKTRIEVGYGLEGELPDAIASRIIRSTIIPHFQSDNYAQGIIAGTEAIIESTQGSPPAEEEESGASPGSIFGLIGFGFIILQWIIGILERSKSWWLGGVLGGIFGLILVVLEPWGIPLWGGVTLSTLFVITGLFLDKTVSEGYQEAKGKGKGSRIPWYSGGGSYGGGSSSGGSFGGFGGGSSGGGGASGSW